MPRTLAEKRRGRIRFTEIERSAIDEIRCRSRSLLEKSFVSELAEFHSAVSIVLILRSYDRARATVARAKMHRKAVRK